MAPLTPHNHGLLRFYQFRDRKLEEEFQGRSHGWRLVPFRIYCCAAVFLEFMEMLVYKELLELPPSFWVHVAALVVATLLFVGSLRPGRLGRRVLVIHVVFCCLMASMYAYMIGDKAHRLTTQNNIALQPLQGCLKDCHDGLEAFLRSMNAYGALCWCLLATFNHWITTGLLGLNAWTCAAQAIVPCTLVIGTALTPDASAEAFGIMAFVAIFTTSASVYISFALEKSRRSAFLAQALLAQELSASQMADSILNHTLKNTLADVAANIEVFLAGEVGPKVLEDGIACLRRGIRSCKERMVYLRLVAGEYAPLRHAVHLREFGQQLIAGRDVCGRFPEVSVYTDSMLLNLILENAISNAFKHGHPETPDVHLDISSTLQGNGREVTCCVTNVAHPERPPLTEEFVERLFAGTADLQSDAVVPMLSDRIGIVHCVMAAKLGNISLSLTQSEETVTFRAVFFAELVRQPEVYHRPSSSTVGHQFPAGLRYFCIDDSLAAQRLVQFHIRKWCQPALVRCFGATEADVELFLASAVMGADIVIIDQHLNYKNVYYGTELTKQLLEMGYQGLICIRSGDDSPEDVLKYTDSGAHCSFGKDMLGAKMIEELKVAYVQRQARATSRLLPPQPHSPALLSFSDLSVGGSLQPPTVSHQTSSNVEEEEEDDT